jgi:hypothetical protein
MSYKALSAELLYEHLVFLVIPNPLLCALFYTSFSQENSFFLLSSSALSEAVDLFPPNQTTMDSDYPRDSYIT